LRSCAYQKFSIGQAQSGKTGENRTKRFLASGEKNENFTTLQEANVQQLQDMKGREPV
jgi:hypothetical protein